MSAPPQDGLAALARTQTEIARIRGWSRFGAHERAAKALDAALASLSAAEAALRDAPYAQSALAALRSDLDLLTGGT